MRIAKYDKNRVFIRFLTPKTVFLTQPKKSSILFEYANYVKLATIKIVDFLQNYIIYRKLCNFVEIAKFVKFI